jgi:hypothetical protein
LISGNQGLALAARIRQRRDVERAMKTNTRQVRLVIATTLTLTLVTVGMALAQTDAAKPPDYDWRHGTTLNVLAGVNSASSRVGLLGGAAFGWEVTPRFAVEGTGSWLDRGRFANVFAADVKASISATGPGKVVPFIGAGMGLYRVSFERAQAAVPDFYHRRMEMKRSAFRTAIFTDPTVVVSSGANLFLTERVSVRPEVELKVIARDSRSYTVTVVAMRLAYHFEEHPITPSRARR